MKSPSQETIDALLARHSPLLAFPKDVESYFQARIRDQRTRHIWNTSWAGSFVYLLFALCDYALLPDIYLHVWQFRFLVAFPVFAATSFLFGYIANYHVREGLVAVVAFLIGATTVWLVLQSRAPLAVQELAGFCLFIVFSNVVVRFRFVLASVVSTAFFIYFVIISLAASHIPIASHINNFVLLFSAASVSLLGNYWHEMEERRSFLLAERDAARKQELQQANDTLENLSYRDGLTSSYNKRYFDLRFPQLLAYAQVNRTPLWVLFIDVDHFKAFNDSYGHIAGDRALVRVAAVLNASFRRRDEIIARTGGEEFVGLLPGVSKEQAIEIAEKVRLAICDLGIPHAQSTTADVVTISVGVAGLDPDITQYPHQLLAAADAALYKAKQSGRNCVVIESVVPVAPA